MQNNLAALANTAWYEIGTAQHQIVDLFSYSERIRRGFINSFLCNFMGFCRIVETFMEVRNGQLQIFWKLRETNSN